MGMSLGMIGAIGGAGEGISTLGGALMKDAEETQALAKKKDYEGWLLGEQDKYAVAREGRAEQTTIRTEQRTDQRTEEQKNRDFTRLQGEAPARRDIKVADTIAGKEGELKFETDNRVPLAANTAAQAEAKQTKATAEHLRGETNKEDATAEYYRTFKAEAERLRQANKLNPADDHELKGLEKRLENKETVINKAMAGEGGIPWDPVKNPGHRQLQTEVAALNLRRNAILSSYRGGGGEAADPQGLRTPDGMIGGKPYKMASPRSAEPPVNPEAEGLTGGTKFDTSDPNLRAGIDNIKDPKERARARAQLSAQVAPMGGASGTPMPIRVKTHDGLPAMQNPDGSYSTELSITVTDPRMNGGKPTNIPSLWGGKVLSEDDAVQEAVASGTQYQSFPSIEAAVSAAKARSAAGGAGAPPAAVAAPTAPVAPSPVNLNDVPAAKSVREVVQVLRDQLTQQTAPAKPARDPLLEALNPSGNASLDSVMGPKVAQLRPLYDAAQAAQAEVAPMAKTAPGAVGQAIAKANAARARLRQAIENMGRTEGMDPTQVQSIVARLTAP